MGVPDERTIHPDDGPECVRRSVGDTRVRTSSEAITGSRIDALDRAPLVAPKGRNLGGFTNLWRLRSYLRPRYGQFLGIAVLDLVDMSVTLAIPLITKAAIDGPIARGDKLGAVQYGLFALVIGVLNGVSSFWRRWMASGVSLATEASVRLDLYAQMQRLPLSFHDKWPSGQLLSRVMSDLSIMRRFTSFGLFMLVVSTVQILVTLGLLLNLYWPLGVLVLIGVVPVIYIGFQFQRQYNKVSRRTMDQNGDVTGRIEESIQGLRVIRAFGRRGWMYRRFDRSAVKLYESQLAKAGLMAKFIPMIDAISPLIALVVLGLSAFAYAHGIITLGTVVAFMTLLMGLIWPMTAVGELLGMFQEACTAADRVTDVLDTESDIVSGPTKIGRARGALRFEGVNFRFPDGNRDVLHDFTLDIAPGESIALVGETGSGKTTVTDLVPRLRDVTGGAITLDGVDLRELDLYDLRSNIATAFEDATLFSMSARENLTLGRPDATDEQIAEAIEVAQAHFVYELPHGLETRIGEQGMSLSGGQRQRLALARAVLTGPSVLVLDDTLSALDIHTEAKVEAALAQVLGTATSIVVAHRASTVMLADRVAVLAGGRIIALGTHHELLASSPEYRHLMSAHEDPVDGAAAPPAPMADPSINPADLAVEDSGPELIEPLGLDGRTDLDDDTEATR